LSEPADSVGAVTELAVRTAYDTVAVSYADLFRSALAASPFDRAVLGIFAELVSGRVADVGCGPGRITGHLHQLGLDVFGVDLSPQMVAVARADHPQLCFDIGTITELDVADGSLGGVVAWYSVIHTPPAAQPAIFAELARVLEPGGQALLAFQVGPDQHVHLEQGYGHDISLDVYRMDPDRVTAELDDAGLDVYARLVRDPAGREKTPQAYLLATRQ
jgi:SAM-dependent methyltransferase